MSPTRRSPPTARVVQLLDHLIARRGQRFGLSELARDLGISKPTCLGMVTELTAGGYLMCDPATKRYGLGPALVAAGRLARSEVAAGDIARRHLDELSAHYGTTCTASAVSGEQIIMLECAGPASASDTVKVGQVYPFAPPVGLMYVLWDSDAAFERWLNKPPTLPVDLDAVRLRRVVAECRDRGYLVERLTSIGMRLHSLLAGVAAYDLPAEVRELVGEVVSGLGERVYLGAELSARKKHPVSVIAAPTFDADGSQELVLTLYVGESITGAEIARRGAAVARTADVITTESGGRKPH